MMYSSVVLALSQEVAEFTAKAERYVGVTSGGMDQAISIMGMPGIAKLVDFNPVSSIEYTALPWQWQAAGGRQPACCAAGCEFRH